MSLIPEIFQGPKAWISRFFTGTSLWRRLCSNYLTLTSVYLSKCFLVPRSSVVSFPIFLVLVGLKLFYSFTIFLVDCWENAKTNMCVWSVMLSWESAAFLTFLKNDFLTFLLQSGVMNYKLFLCLLYKDSRGHEARWIGIRGGCRRGILFSVNVFA